VAEAPAEAGAFGDDESARNERPKGVRWVNALRTIVGFSVAALGAWALAFGAHRYALRTPRFALTQVEVSGTKRLTQGEVLSLGHLELGKNILSLDLELAERTLMSSPWIRDARVERRLPGTLRITLDEREPRALGLVSGQLYLVSERGELFKALGEQDAADFPVVSALPENARAPLSAQVDSRFRQGVELLDEYAHTPLAAEFAAEEVHFDAEGHTVLTVGREGTELHLGLPPYREKLERAGKVLLDSRTLGALPGTVFLDNTAHPERVIVRARN
jgi:cell division protein FtsQ